MNLEESELRLRLAVSLLAKDLRLKAEALQTASRHRKKLGKAVGNRFEDFGAQIGIKIKFLVLDGLGMSGSKKTPHSDEAKAKFSTTVPTRSFGLLLALI